MGTTIEQNDYPAGSPPACIAPQRILMVAHEWFADRPGGGGRYLQEVSCGLAQRGHKITVVVPHIHPDAPAVEVWKNVTIVRLSLGTNALGWLIRMFRELPRVLTKFGPFDVVHAHFAPMALVPLWHPALRHTRRVCQFQGPWAGESRIEGSSSTHVALQHLLERITYARCERFIVLSQAFATLLSNDYGIPAQRVSVVPSGLDLARFHPAKDRQRLKEKLGLPPGPLVFTARRLVHRMGLEILIQAWATVLESHPTAQLWIAGEGPLANTLASQVRACRLDTSITLLGRIDDERLIQCHQAADAFVLPTVALEGFGLVTLEALACGTPVLGTHEGATPEILAPLEPSLLVPPNDVTALATGLTNLLAREGLDEFRNVCRQYVERHFGWPVALGRIEALLADG
ncbi:MAG: glycosyltransferase family 4 protein [Candidatus Sericytochromatia bacterium]|nr:glycosyltransferase family 4 protein [Candidatus Sericytochromatia bacterium]